jgi:hypothetical protein
MTVSGWDGYPSQVRHLLLEPNRRETSPHTSKKMPAIPQRLKELPCSKVIFFAFRALCGKICG